MCWIMASYEHILGSLGNGAILRSLGNGPVRRSLFGPVDREQLQQEYQNALRKDLADATHRWGFDFLSETPLKGGNFQWEAVPGAKVPLFYRPCMVGLNQPAGQRKEVLVAAPSVRAETSVKAGPSIRAGPSVKAGPSIRAGPLIRMEPSVRAGPSARALPAPSGKENIPRTPERNGAILARSLEKTPRKGGENGLKRKQTNITDFYAAKRRAMDTPRKSRQ